MTAGLALLLLLSLHARSQDAAPDQEGLDLFEKRIRPVLIDRCYSCHSAKAEKLKGKWNGRRRRLPVAPKRVAAQPAAHVAGRNTRARRRAQAR